MKRLVAIGLVLLSSTLVFAQETTKKKKQAASGDEQALTQLENDWGMALVKRDFTALDRFVTADWVLTTPDGKMQTKAQVDADMKSGKIKFESFKLEEIKVRLYGDTAVVFGLTTEKLTVDGKEVSGQNRFTDTFLKRDGRWQCVATHVTAVEPSK